MQMTIAASHLSQPDHPDTRRPFGEQLRQLRQSRRLSQLALSLHANVSARHLCFLETGRSTPSREMVLRLGQCLDAPLRERNQWLMSAGYAPMYAEHNLNDGALEEARALVQHLLDRHAPYPAMAMDGHWNILASNGILGLLLGDAAPTAPPFNVLRLCHDTPAISSRIANLPVVRENHMWRLRQQVRLSGDPVLIKLLAELEAIPRPPASTPPVAPSGLAGLVMPFELHSPLGVLSFITMTTVFGRVVDITLSEMAIELFLPANTATAEAVQKLVGATR